MEYYSSQDFYTIEAIIGKKILRGQFYYLIKWKDYPIQDSTWEPKSQLQVIENSLNDYDQATQGMKLPVFSKQYEAALRRKKQNKDLPKIHKISSGKKQSMAKLKSESPRKTPAQKNKKSKGKSAKKSPKNINDSLSTIYEYESKTLNNDEFKSRLSSQKDDQNTKSLCRNFFQSCNQEDQIERRIAECLYSNTYPKILKNHINQSEKFSETSSNTFRTPNFGDSQEEEGEIVEFNHLGKMDQNREIESFDFIKKVQGTTNFDLENLYRVSFKNGMTLEMITKDLTRKYPTEFVKYLEYLINFN